MRQGDYFQTFCFLQKLYMSKSKWSATYFKYVDDSPHIRIP